MIIRDLLARTGRRAAESMNDLSRILRLKQPGIRQLDLVSMEDRLLFSAAPGPAPAPPADAVQFNSAIIASLNSPMDLLSQSHGVPADTNSASGVPAPAVENTSSHVTHELVFVDAGIQNYQELLNDLQTHQDANRHLDVVLLSSSENGISQITATLAQYRTERLDAVHVLSHGTSEGLQLGNMWLNAQTLMEYGDEIRGWQSSFTADGDLLLYGCNLAATAQGQSLVNTLGDLTGADVAASDDNTGSSLFGGDWTLEYRYGNIETAVALNEADQQTWVNLLNAAVDSASSGFANGVTSLNVAHTTTGTNRLMLVAVSTDPHGMSVSSMSYNGANLSYVGSMENPGSHSRVEIWSLVAPSTGTYNVAVNFTGGTGYHGVIVGVMTFTGVDQANPLANFNSAFGTTGPASVTVASQTNDLVFSAVHSHSNFVPIAGTGLTEYWNDTSDQSYGAGAVASGATFVTNTWTVANKDWTAAGVSVRSYTNSAPVLDATKSPALNNQREDDGVPVGAVGTLVSSLVDFASPSGQVDNVTDVDVSPSTGIAITSADTTNGSWWYSTDGGSNWNSLGVVSNSSSRLLAADANTRLYFQPNTNYQGVLANAITFRAWDQTSGVNGGLASTTTNGGNTAFSTATDTASLVVKFGQ